MNTNENGMVVIANLRGTFMGHDLDITTSVNAENEGEAVAKVMVGLISGFIEGVTKHAPSWTDKVIATIPTFMSIGKRFEDAMNSAMGKKPRKTKA